MSLMLLRIDGCPLQEDELSFALKSWLSILADTINSSYDLLEGVLSPLLATSMTAAEIVAAFTAGELVNGVLLYDTTNDEYVGMQAGVLKKFTTTNYP